MLHWQIVASFTVHQVFRHRFVFADTHAFTIHVCQGL